MIKQPSENLAAARLQPSENLAAARLQPSENLAAARLQPSELEGRTSSKKRHE